MWLTKKLSLIAQNSSEKIILGNNNNLSSCSFILAIQSWDWILLTRASFRLVQTESLVSVGYL